MERLRTAREHGFVGCLGCGRERRGQGFEPALERVADARSLVETIHRQPGEHRVVGQLHRARPPVPLLDEQPLLAGVVLALEPDEGEPAAQLVAGQVEQQLAVGETGAEVLQFDVRAPVPDDDAAGPVVAFGDAPLEIGVVEGMVLDQRREALVLGIHGRTLRHGPGTQHVVDLEPEVPMQPGGGMLLDDEQPPAVRDRVPLGGGERLRRHRRLPLGAVLGQPIGTC